MSSFEKIHNFTVSVNDAGEIKTTSDGQIYRVTSTILAGPCLADRRLSFSVKSTGNLRATSPNKDKKKTDLLIWSHSIAPASERRRIWLGKLHIQLFALK